MTAHIPENSVEAQDVGRVPDGTGLSSLRDEAASAASPKASIPSRKRAPNGRFLRNLRMTPDGSCEWLIWSRYWGAWHRKSSVGGACGYTDDIARAGLFPRDMAVAYHDGDRDEAFHVSEKMAAINAALSRHDTAIANLRTLKAAVA